MGTNDLFRVLPWRASNMTQQSSKGGPPSALARQRNASGSMVARHCMLAGDYHFYFSIYVSLRASVYLSKFAESTASRASFCFILDFSVSFSCFIFCSCLCLKVPKQRTGMKKLFSCITI